VTRLRRIRPDQIPAVRVSLPDATTMRDAAAIVEDVRARGEIAVREHARRLGDLQSGEPLVYERRPLEEARDRLPDEDRAVLERAAASIARFALAQRASLHAARSDALGGLAVELLWPADG